MTVINQDHPESTETYNHPYYEREKSTYHNLLSVRRTPAEYRDLKCMSMDLED